MWGVGGWGWGVLPWNRIAPVRWSTNPLLVSIIFFLTCFPPPLLSVKWKKKKLVESSLLSTKEFAPRPDTPVHSDPESEHKQDVNGVKYMGCLGYMGLGQIHALLREAQTRQGRVWSKAKRQYYIPWLCRSMSCNATFANPFEDPCKSTAFNLMLYNSTVFACISAFSNFLTSKWSSWPSLYPLVLWRLSTPNTVDPTNAKWKHIIFTDLPMEYQTVLLDWLCAQQQHN